MDADSFQAHYDLALAYRDMGMLEGALTELAGLKRIRIWRFKARHFRGSAYELGRYEAALEAFEAAMNLPVLSLEQRLGLGLSTPIRTVAREILKRLLPGSKRFKTKTAFSWGQPTD